MSLRVGDWDIDDLFFTVIFVCVGVAILALTIMLGAFSIYFATHTDQLVSDTTCQELT